MSSPRISSIAAVAVAASAIYLIFNYHRHHDNKDGNDTSSVKRSGYEVLIGNTPLIELKVASSILGCRILVKVHENNVMGSKQHKC